MILIFRNTEAATGGVLHKRVLENFTTLTGKHLCWGHFFNKVASLSLQLLKKDSGTGVFL